jgi:hypothetical protein
MATDPEVERILSEPYEPTEAERRHQNRIEADPWWPHEGGLPIGQIGEDAPIAKLVRHHESKRGAGRGDPPGAIR